jgi:hypothetical protein
VVDDQLRGHTLYMGVAALARKTGADDGQPGAPVPGA